MDKKKQIQFNLNNFLLAMSTAFDYVQKDVDGVRLGHAKRVAYIAILLAKEFNYEPKGLFDVCAYAFMYNNALKHTGRISKEYCELGQELANKFPFLTDETDVIKYSCEAYDGSGVFGLKADEIPLFSQFIYVASTLDREFDLSNHAIDNRKRIINHMKANENILYSTDMVECICEFALKTSFWLDLQSEIALLNEIFSTLQDFSQTPTFEEVLELTSLFSERKSLIDSAATMADYYEFEHKDKQTFLIAASLCQIGKWAVPDRIISKEDALSTNEYEIVKSYPYYTQVILSNILGFSDICSWASAIQENIDGSGYPYALEGKDLSLKHRLLSILVKYDALVSEKPFRKAMSHEAAIEVLDKMASDVQIDASIVKDVAKTLIK